MRSSGSASAGGVGTCSNQKKTGKTQTDDEGRDYFVELDPETGRRRAGRPFDCGRRDCSLP